MTKRNLLLVSLLLVFGLAGMATSALAQVTWQTAWNAREGGRSEGLTEATGQVSLGTTGSSGVVGANTGFTIMYNQPIVPGSVVLQCTSGTVGSGGGPWDAPLSTPPPGYAPCQGNSDNNANYPLTYTLGTGPISYSPTTGGANQLYVVFTNSTPFTGAFASQINITVRVDATSEACSQIYAQSVGGTPHSNTSLTISNPNYPNPILYVGCEPNLSLAIASADTNAKADGDPAQVLTCIGVKNIASYDNSFCVNVDEEFQHALTTQSFEYALDPGYPLTDVTNPTQVVITFWDVPSGVGIASKTITPCSAFSAGNPNGCNTSTYTGTLTLGLDSSGCVADTGAQTVTCTYDTLTMDNGNKESVDICFRIWSDGPIAPVANPTTNGTVVPQIYATIAKGPSTPASAIPLFSGILETGQRPSVVEFYNCETNLLYPFVTNYLAGGGTAYNNLGTEIFVANTTVDPLNTTALNGANLNPQEAEGTATPQSGTCTFWLFPNASSALTSSATVGAGTMQSLTSPVIPAGATYGFDLGSVSAFAGQTGYIYAKCLFQNAHGIEYVTDNYALGEPENSFGFQAIVIPTPEFYHRTPAGDGLGESAVAPIALSKLVQKLLSGGIHNGPSTHGH